MLNRIRLVLTCFVGCVIFTVSSVQARYENDVRLSTLLDSAIPDFVYPQDYTGDTTQPPELEDEIRIYLEQGYHPVTVLFYAMRNGMSVNQVIEIAEQAGLPGEHFQNAIVSLEPVLPGGVCGTSYFVKDPTAVPGNYSLTGFKEELSSEQNNGSGSGDAEPKLADLIERFFEGNEVISVNEEDPNLRQVHDMDWPETVSKIPASGVPTTVQEFVNSNIPAHIYATPDELLALADQSNEFWFFQDSPLGEGQNNSEILSANSPIFVSLYAGSREAVVSPWQLERINQAKLDGTILPVMLFYNNQQTRPLSQISKKIGFAELVNAYLRAGIKVSPSPSWEEGNYHTQATAQQLRELFDLPEKTDIPEERYNKALSTIDNGRPLQVSMVGGKMFVGNPDRAVAMIEDGGYDLLPVNVSYVDLEPSEINFSDCENAFPFAGVGLGGIGGNTPSGVVFVPEEPECVPTTETIKKPKRIQVHVSPDRFKTVIEEKTITIPCPEE